jgi:hypothetical protein
MSAHPNGRAIKVTIVLDPAELAMSDRRCGLPIRRLLLIRSTGGRASAPARR